MGKNTKHTSAKVGSLAGKVLQDDRASARDKKLAASALSQMRPGAETSDALAKQAARVLESDKVSATTATLAGSILAQSEHKPSDRK